MVLNREELLGRRGVRYMDVDVEGGTVRIKSFSELERSQYEVACLSSSGKQTNKSLRDMRAMLLCRCIVDENGERILNDDDVERVHEMDAIVTARVFDAAVKHIGITTDDIDELAKNSEAIHVA